MLVLAGCSSDAEGPGGECPVECALHETRCGDDGLQICQEDSEGCLQWSESVECGEESRCDDGRCVEVCADSCEEGERRCDGAGGFQLCHEEADGCHDWTSTVECPDDESCEDGVCESDCTDVCDEGETRCSGADGFQVCQESAEGCLDWTDSVECEEGLECSGGVCVESCQDQCEPDDKVCVGGPGPDFQVCEQQPSGCWDWSPIESCEDGQWCESGECVDACSDECDDGDTRCEDDGVEYCVENAQGCYQWTDPVECGQEMECDDGQCLPECDDECSDKATQCDGEDGYQVCQQQPDGCLDWSTTFDCQDDQQCSDGDCVECTPGASRCSDDGVPQECQEVDGDYEFVDQSSCDDAEICQDGSCLEGCDYAEEVGSSVGCEYWAVETDNYMLHSSADGDSTVDPDERPPFAVVLTNTRSDVTAEVTVDGPDGAPADLVEEREVDTGTSPVDPETVYSETLDEDGDQIGGPHDGPAEDLELPPDSMLVLLLPNQDIPYGATSVTSTAYRIETTEPVAAHQFNPFCCNYNHTTDASTLLPVESLSQDYMMSGPAVWAREGSTTLDDPFSPTLSVVATEPDTEVEVQLREPVLDGYSSGDVDLQETCPGPPDGGDDQQDQYEDEPGCFVFPAGDDITGPDASGVMEVTLDEHEVLNVGAGGAYPTVDLTGAIVEADETVAAFGAHTCTNVPFTASACDHVESQLYPLETWGTEFVAAPHELRNPDADPDTSQEGTYWKFVAREDDTVVDLDISIEETEVLGPAGEHVARCSDDRFDADPVEGTFELDQGEYCEFGTREGFEIDATSPVKVAGMMSGQNTAFDDVDWGDQAGDPSMFYLAPVDGYRDDYEVVVPPTYAEHYMTVTVEEGEMLELDDQSVDPTSYEYHEVGDTGYLNAHIPVESGARHIRSAEGVDFGLVVYGFDNYVSYSYTGGLMLEAEDDFDGPDGY